MKDWLISKENTIKCKIVLMLREWVLYTSKTSPIWTYSSSKWRSASKHKMSSIKANKRMRLSLIRIDLLCLESKLHNKILNMKRINKMIKANFKQEKLKNMKPGKNYKNKWKWTLIQKRSHKRSSENSLKCPRRKML